MRKLFDSMFAKDNGEIPAPVGSYNGFTLSDWQRSQAHVNWARETMATPIFRDLLAVLSNARPQTRLSGINDTEAAISLGRRIGYDEMMSVMLALTRFTEAETPSIEADYGAGEFELNSIH